ncbi:hypothetical protein ON010_g14446 [Phytophthora cinnamomi]|nr:hypothetical protein ON010_g14446 [Phytophthora cinnamomi]
MQLEQPQPDLQVQPHHEASESVVRHEHEDVGAKEPSGDQPVHRRLRRRDGRFDQFVATAICVDDGGSFTAATTKFVDMPCNPNSVNQVFKFNIKTGGIKSVNKPGLCIDDGGSLTAASAMSSLWYCDINNQNQCPNQHVEVLSRAALMEEKKSAGSTPYDLLSSVVMLRVRGKNNLCVFKYNIRTLEYDKPGLCIDDGGALSADGSTSRLGYCDPSNQNQCLNQHFEILSRAEMLDEKKNNVGGTTYDTLTSGQEIMLRVRGKGNLCVDDGGDWRSGTTNFVDQLCDPDRQNQIFQYNLQTRDFESANKPGLCIDDVLDEDTLILHNPKKTNLCLDDGEGTFPGDTNFMFSSCGNDNPHKHFEIVSRTDSWRQGERRASRRELMTLNTLHVYTPSLPDWTAPERIADSVITPPNLDNGFHHLDYAATSQNPTNENKGNADSLAADQVVSAQLTSIITTAWANALAGNFGPDQCVIPEATDTSNLALQPIRRPLHTNALPTNPDQVGLTGPAVLPFQGNDKLPIPTCQLSSRTTCLSPASS